ncbi:hypothetical protein IWX76_000254 [Pedobacter sp. CAN_A7]|uniref:hypothetical protein n=1 Tax=Pedobacter sp. CAN_A7 TaxID=2787722 RepID=UPI0018C9EC34
MKLKLSLSLLIILLVSGYHSGFAQSDLLGRKDKLYTSSGFGFSIPVGETADYFEPKFSTTIGLNIGLGNGGVFLYPKVSLHAYKYDQPSLDQGQTTLLHDGRATTYLLNMAIGYRKFHGNFAYYGFVGGGGGFLLTPRIELNNTNAIATQRNENVGMAMLETGLGMEYSFNKVSVFLESSFMHGFKKIQDRRFQSVPISIGIKPNLSSILNGKK